MRALFDVNFLLALLQPDHAHFDRAHQWWQANRHHGWASCPLTENGFAPVISKHPYPKPRPVAEAVTRLAELIHATDHVFWPDDVSITDHGMIDTARLLGPNQITDVYLLALAVKNDGRLVTFDRSIPLRAVRGAEPRHLVML